jgi:hypothetical membrane protein
MRTAETNWSLVIVGLLVTGFASLVFSEAESKFILGIFGTLAVSGVLMFLVGFGGVIKR